MKSMISQPGRAKIVAWFAGIITAPARPDAACFPDGSPNPASAHHQNQLAPFLQRDVRGAVDQVVTGPLATEASACRPCMDRLPAPAAGSKLVGDRRRPLLTAKHLQLPRRGAELHRQQRLDLFGSPRQFQVRLHVGDDLGRLRHHQITRWSAPAGTPPDADRTGCRRCQLGNRDGWQRIAHGVLFAIAGGFARRRLIFGDCLVLGCRFAPMRDWLFESGAGRSVPRSLPRPKETKPKALRLVGRSRLFCADGEGGTLRYAQPTVLELVFCGARILRGRGARPSPVDAAGVNGPARPPTLTAGASTRAGNRRRPPWRGCPFPLVRCFGGKQRNERGCSPALAKINPRISGTNSRNKD